MENTNKNNKSIWIVVGIIIIVLAAIAYSTGKNYDGQSNQKQQADKLSVCLVQAENNENTTIKYWNDYKNTNCNMYSDVLTGGHCINTVNEGLSGAKTQYTQDKNDCYKQYPQ